MTGIWTMGWVSWFHAWKGGVDSERHRRERAVQLTEALHRLVSQLLGMSVPAELRKPLKRFARIWTSVQPDCASCRYCSAS